MTSQRKGGSLSKEAEDPYQPQNFSGSSGIGTRQDEDEWLRQHGASGFSGFSGSNNQQEVCLLKEFFLFVIWCVWYCANSVGFQSNNSQSSREGVKLAEPSEHTTFGKYSYTHDDLIDPDE